MTERPRALSGSQDEYWVQRVRAGDARALEFLFRRHVDRVYRFALAMLRSREEAEEVAADTFVRVFQFAQDLRGTGTFEAWLLRIARNQCLDRLRRPGLLTLPLEAAGEGPGLPAGGEDADRAALRFSVEQALERLSEDYRVVLHLRDVEGLSAREVADVLGRTEAATRSLHQRARRALRTELVAEEPEAEGEAA